MILHLCIPGLLWPNTAAELAAQGLHTPALNTLLGKGSTTALPGDTLDHWLLHYFGLHAPQRDEDNPTSDLPLAWLRYLGDYPQAPVVPAEAEHLLCIDPIYLHFAQDTLLVADIEALHIEPAAMHELLNTLQADFADAGEFFSPHSTRWYLRSPEPIHARFAPFADAVGRPMRLFMDDLEANRPWRRLGNELQVWLFNHPLNQARSDQGQACINGVWMWGSGQWTAPGQHSAAQQLLSDYPLARGLARAQGLPTDLPTLDNLAPTQSSTTLVVLEEAHRPMLYLHAEAWRDAIQQLEKDWFAPALARLRSGELEAIQISSPADKVSVDIEIRRRDLWKFWRKPRAVSSLSDLLPKAFQPIDFTQPG